MEGTYLWGYQAVCDGAGWEEWVDERVDERVG